jgi:hypothetical protein
LLVEQRRNDGPVGVVVTGVLGRTAPSPEALYNDDVPIGYGADRKLLWQKEFSDSGGAGASGFVTTDAQGGVYFASGFHNKSYGSLFPFVSKFDLNGVQQWFTNVQVPVRDKASNSYRDQDRYINRRPPESTCRQRPIYF